MLRTNEILADEEAKRIIMTLYDNGYRLGVYIGRRILGPRMTREVEEDLMQEVSLKLTIHVEKILKMTPRERMAYMAKIARTAALDEARRQTQRQLLDSLDDPNCPEPESLGLSPEEYYMMLADVMEKRTNVRAALARMTERDRRLLIEKYKNGRSDVEIGEMLDIKPRNVRVYIARARHKAAIYYGEEVDEKRKESRAGTGSKGTGSKRKIDRGNKSK